MTRKRLRWVVAGVGIIVIVAVTAVIFIRPWSGPVEPDPPDGPRTSADGDPLPPGAITRIGTGRFRTGGQIWVAAVTPDGRSLIVSDRIMDASTGVVVGHIPHEVDGEAVGLGVVSVGGETAALSDSPRGAYGPQTIVLWDIATHKPLHTVRLPASTSRGYLRSVARGGGQVLFQNSSRQFELWTALHDSPKAVPLGTADGDGRNDPAGFTPDGRFVVDAGAKLKGWDAATGGVRFEFDGPEGVGVRWAVSRDGRRMALVSQTPKLGGGEEKAMTYRVSVWDLPAGTRRWESAPLNTDGEFPGTLRVLFTPDGETVVATDVDRAKKRFAVRRWGATDGKPLGEWTTEWRAMSGAPVLLAPDGRSVYFVTQFGVRTFALESGEESSPPDLRGGDEWPVGFTPDGKHLVTRRNTTAVLLRDPDSGLVVRELKLPNLPDTFNTTVSPDGRLLAVDATVGPKNDRDTVVYECESGRELYRLRGERCGTFTPDGKHLLTLPPDYKTTNVHDPNTGELLRTVACNGNDSFYFSPDGGAFARHWQHNIQVYAIGGESLFDGTALLRQHVVPMQVGSGPEQRMQNERADRISATAIGPGGRRFAVAYRRVKEGGDPPSSDRLLMFDTSEKKPLWEVEVKRPSQHWEMNYMAASLAFSPDGRRLALGGRRGITLYDATSGDEVRRYEGHTGEVRFVQFSPGGKRLLAADGDGTVWVWDATAR